MLLTDKTQYYPLPDGMQTIVGEASSTFTAVPAHRALTLGQYVDHHMHHSAQHIAMRWFDDDGVKEHTLTWFQFAQGVHRAAQIVTKELGQQGCTVPGQQTYVALMANGDIHTYFATVLGIVRAGFTVFPLSTNNSAEATAHLLRAKDCAAVIGNVTGTVPALEAVLNEAMKSLTSSSVRRLDWLSFERLFDDAAAFEPLAVLQDTVEEAKLDQAAIILHSSGSTSFPKPITLTHRSFVSYILARNYGAIDRAGKTTFIGHLPLFHAMSHMIGIPMMIGWGFAAGLFAPCTPAKPPNPVSTLSAAVRVKSAWIAVPPVFLQVWFQREEWINQLKQIELVTFAGGPLLHETGMTLFERGVHLNTAYASTEVGMRVHIELYYREPAMWEWCQDLPTIKSYFRRQTSSSNEAPVLYEYLVGQTAHFKPNVLNDKLDDGTPVYATDDLVELHPTRPGLFRFVGRADQQIVLSTGEKTNPAPLNMIVESDRQVSGCVYFGSGKTHNGIIVEPAATEAATKANNFVDAIWPSVQKANRFAPSHSYIYKEMIVVSSPSKPFQRTGKGSLRYQAILQDYKDEVQSAYDAFARGGGGGATAQNGSKSNGDIVNSATVRDIVLSSLVRNKPQDFTGADDDADLFATLGADSLVAARIRNALVTATNNSSLPFDVVYRNPTVRLLTEAVSKATARQAHNPTKDLAVSVLSMDAMVQKYSQDWPKRGAQQKQQHRPVTVLITGSTGGLGSHLLAKLLQSDSVSKVYALIRPGKDGNDTIASRQRQAFAMRGCDVGLLTGSGGKLHLLDSQLDRPLLGLDKIAYSTLASTVTVVYHLAWRLDFNLALSSFEEHIKATRSLLDLALHSDAVFVFSSSVSVCLGTSDKPVKEDGYVPLADAAALGYGASKAVAERIVEQAHVDRRLRVRNIRIGQLSGSTSNGAWATTDWVPIMIKSSIALGSVPLAPRPDSRITWLPSDVCADVLFELAEAAATDINDGTGCTRHIIHTQRTTWDDFAQSAAQELGLKSQPYSTWLNQLEVKTAGHEDLDDIPAAKLLSFFKSIQGEDSNEAFTEELDCSRALAESQSLRNAEQTSKKTVQQWISYWRSIGFI